ncbi:MAG: ATP synthase F1, gamma subunit [Parcubacteria bacterium C7867-004]|nr:MAG: ATP synthase F1, gamma subunit [Parcubacteria bacterium C7867-004]
MALKDIKTKIKATERMHKVTRAMEAVSAVKMRKTQGSAFLGRPYARAALAILARLSGSADLARHPLAKDREVKRTALIIITSDKGLAGGLNSGVIKAAASAISGRAVADITVFAYGRKGEEYFARRDYAIARAIENKVDDVPVSVMEELSAELSKGFLAGEYDEVVAVYSNFKSTFEQIPTVRRLLPLSIDTLTQLVTDIQPVKGKWSEMGAIESPASYSVEPSDEDVLGLLVPKLVSVSLYHMLLESKASEHSARMVAMKNASDKSKEVVRDLTRKFNKVRQAAITREVSEIVSGREALST